MTCRYIKEMDLPTNVIHCLFKGYVGKTVCTSQGRLTAIYKTPKAYFLLTSRSTVGGRDVGGEARRGTAAGSLGVLPGPSEPSWQDEGKVSGELEVGASRLAIPNYRPRGSGHGPLFRSPLPQHSSRPALSTETRSHPCVHSPLVWAGRASCEG